VVLVLLFGKRESLRRTSSAISLEKTTGRKRRKRRGKGKPPNFALRLKGKGKKKRGGV